MPKLFWVTLPLLAAAALVVLQAVRHRLPSRQALNIGSSVLLIAYASTTLGLGIFWVANQQLPVFDWHYLFGYTTAALIALHLAFNLGIVWRYFRRKRVAATSQTPPPVPEPSGQRRVLAIAGVLLATGVAFVLGLRHGRSELRLVWPLGGSGADEPGAQPQVAGALALVERYHAFSSHSRAGMLLRAPSVDWGAPLPPFKRYPRAPRVALPTPRSSPSGAVDLASLAAVLWHTAGITDARAQVALRASPSAGALFSTELYAAVRNLVGLAPGLWHYDAQTHALEQLRTTMPSVEALGAPAQPLLRDAAATVVATVVFRRTGYKYRDRTYRYVLVDLGHALENLRVAADALGLLVDVASRFDEARVAATLGIDEGAEGVLVLAALRARPPEESQNPPPELGPSRQEQAEPAWRSPPAPTENEAALGVTGAIHAATSLRVAPPPAAATAGGAAPVPAAPAPPAGSIKLPAVATVASNVLSVIATRRSVRRFSNSPLALEALGGVLWRMAGSSAALLSTALRVSVVVHSVTGLHAGAYRYDPARHALTPQRMPADASADLRAASRAAALDQDVAADAAALFVLSIDRAALAADPTGAARGYRHALLEAGIVGERVYLEAAARGLAACAVGAFYDEEATALVAIDPRREWVVHLAALGVRPD